MQGTSMSKVASNKVNRRQVEKFLKILRLENLSGNSRLQIVFQAFYSSVEKRGLKSSGSAVSRS